MIKVTMSCGTPVKDEVEEDDKLAGLDEDTKKLIQGDKYISPEERLEKRGTKLVLDWREGYINVSNIISIHPNVDKDDVGNDVGGTMISFNDSSDAQMYVAESIPEIRALIKADRGGLLHDIAMEILKIIDYVTKINKQVKPKEEINNG